MSPTDTDIRDVVAAVGFLMACELPDRVADLLADPDERMVRLVRRLVDLRQSTAEPAMQSRCRG